MPFRAFVVTCIILFLSLPAQSQILQEMEVSVVPEAEWGPYINQDPDRAILVVHSNIPDLGFETNNKGVVDVTQPRAGEYWVYLHPGTHIITVKKDGFMAVRQRIHIPAKAVREFRVTAIPILGAYGGFDEKRPEICLKYTPVSEDEKVFGGLDGNVMKLDFGSGLRSFRPSSGKHVIKLNSQGRIWEKSYDLKPGDVVEDAVTFSSGKTESWDIKEPGGLDISSDPPGVTVFIDQVNQGSTPLILDDLQPGTYQIELVKDLYLAESRSVTVKSLDYAPLSVELTPNFGRLKIETDPPEAMVWINDQQKGLTPYEVPRFNAGKYALRIAQNLYYEESDTFEIEPGGEYIQFYKLNPQFGKVTLTSEPPNAIVTVDGQLWGNTPLTRDKVLSGDQNIRLNIENYFDLEETIHISDGQHFEKNYELRPSVGWLTVSSDPSGANVTIVETKQSLGKTPLKNVPIDRGTYKLLIEKDLYEPFETAIGLTYGGEEKVKAKLQRSVGHIRVSVEPRGTKIYLNNEYKGESPMVVKDVPTGKYELRLESSGYDIQIDQVQVIRNEVTKYSLTLGTSGTVEWKKRRNKARLLSIAVPSSGQFVSGQYVRGSLYGGAFVGALAMAYLSSQDHADAKSIYESEMTAHNIATTQQNMELHLSNARSAWNDMKSAKDQINLMLLAAGGVYVWQLFDAWKWGGGKRPVSGKLSFQDKIQPFVDVHLDCMKVGIRFN